MTMETPTLSAARPTVKRYHPLQVILHWVIAALSFITALLATGGEGEGRRQPAFGAPGPSTLAVHMILGISVLVLLFVRLVMRWRVHPPEWATTGSRFLDRLGKWTHIALYLFAFAVTITGLILALQTNRLSRIFGIASGAPQFPPAQFQAGQFPPPGQSPPGGGFRPGGSEGGEGFGGGFARGGRFFLGAFHGASWIILLLLVILHVAAALYHQFFVRDDLFGRMWFGRTT